MTSAEYRTNNKGPKTDPEEHRTKGSAELTERQHR